MRPVLVLVLVLCAPDLAAAQEKLLGDKTVAEWLKRLEDPKAETRAAALRVLSFGDMRLPAKEIEKHLADPSFRVRLVAAEALAKRGDGAPGPLVAALVDVAAHDPDVVVRDEVGQILRQMGGKAVPVLLADLKSKDQPTREKASLGIDLIGVEAGKAAEQLVQSLKDESRPVRRSIGSALMRLGAASEPALRKALEDKDEALRFAVVEALVTFDRTAPVVFPAGKTSVPPLKELEPLAKHENAILRVRAAALLASSRPAEAEAALLEALAAKDVKLRRAAAACLRLAPGVGAGPLVVPVKPSKAVALASKDEDPGVRLYASQANARFGIIIPGAAAPPMSLISEGLKLDDEDVRHLALRLLTQRPREAGEAAARLGELLDDPDPVVRKHAVYVLAEMGPAAAAALKPLQETGKAPSPFLRQLAMQALGGSRAREALPLLIKGLEDDERNVRLAAVEALGERGAEAGPAVPALVKLLSVEGPVAESRPTPGKFPIIGFPRPTELFNARRYPSGPSTPFVIAALTKIGPTAEAADAIPLLAKRLHAGHRDVARVLGALGGASVPSLVEALKNKELRLAAIMALNSIGPEAKGAASPLAALLKEEDAEVRLQAAFALAQLGPAAKEALPRLLPILEDAKADLDLRLMAIQTVGGIGPDAAAALPILQKLTKESSAALRAASVRALGSIAGADAETRALLEGLQKDPSGVVRQAVRGALKPDKK